MRVRRRPAWPVVMLISGTIASTSIWTAAGQASAAHASGAASPHQAAHAGSSLRTTPGAGWPGVLVRPQAAGFGFLVGVYCTSRTSCWAIGVQGGSGNTTLSQALHWNGKTWRHVKMPSPGGTGPNAKTELAAVRCATASNCWAVGYYVKGGATLNAMLHWNGHKWTAMATPEPAGSGKTSQNELTDVTCISVRSCWAVGYFGKVGASRLDLVLHWNGTKWSRVRVPEPGGTTNVSVNTLNNVRCPTSSRCLAVGSYSPGTGTHKTFNQALSWAGKSWTVQHVPSPGSGTAHNDATLFGLGCGARSSCWAVGAFGPSSQDKFLNQVLHWNGRTWARTAMSQPGGTGAIAVNELAWVTCSSAGNCWAVGIYGQTNPGTELNQAQHWNGRRWALVHTPNPAGTATNDENALLSVRCTSAANCWAVGGTVKAGAGTVADEILHWNGKKWSVSPA
jgi:hypothetical protein